MSKRYNPAPNWPPPPDGWTPPPGWQPDPSWGPPPEGWQLWIDDGPQPKKSKDEELRPDIATAKGKMRVKMGAGREIRKLAGYLWDDEQVRQMTTGMYGKGTGLVVLTDRRLLFVQDGVMSKTTEDFPLDKVSSVQWNSGVLLGSLTIFASGNKAEIKNMNKDDGKEIADVIRQRLSTPTPTPSPTPSAPIVAAVATPDPMEQLKKLGELRDLGVLTPEEFDAKKAEILSRL